ncbi:hypothetical protein N7454_009500 [Penicillium verhagenii]|nr:hypothetical protein N7454_009500 [Penicillium verhagenii]
MRLTAIIAFFLATLAIAAPIEESASLEADLGVEGAKPIRCRSSYNACIRNLVNGVNVAS